MHFRYRGSILAELSRYGVSPGSETPPDLVRDFINDLYRYEIRALKGGLLAGRIPKKDYAARVTELRDRYPILSLPVEYWADKDQGDE
jgi:hypothetical protein